MNQDKKATFKQSGYLLAKGLFKKPETVVFEQEFDKIISQLKKSGENINARWGSGLTKKLESQKSKVIHTHNVQSFSSIMLDMVKNKNLLKIAEALIGPDIILHHTKLFLKPPRIGSAFPLHQDWSYFPTEKNTMIAALVPLLSKLIPCTAFTLAP